MSGYMNKRIFVLAIAFSVLLAITSGCGAGAGAAQNESPGATPAQAGTDQAENTPAAEVPAKKAAVTFMS